MGLRCKEKHILQIVRSFLISLDVDEPQGITEDELREAYLDQLELMYPTFTDAQARYTVSLFQCIWRRLVDRRLLNDLCIDGDRQTGHYSPAEPPTNGLIGLD